MDIFNDSYICDINLHPLSQCKDQWTILRVSSIILINIKVKSYPLALTSLKS